MALAYRATPAVTQSSGNVTSFPVTKQAGTAAGDWIVMYLMGTNSGTIACTGFTVTAQDSDSIGCCIYKQATGSEGSTFTITGIPASTNVTVAIATVSGANSTITVGTCATSGGAGTSLVNTSITMPAAGWTLWFGGEQLGFTGNSFAITAPAGFTSRATNGVQTNNACLMIADNQSAASGATGTKTGTCATAAYWSGVMVGLTPATAAAPAVLAGSVSFTAAVIGAGAVVAPAVLAGSASFPAPVVTGGPLSPTPLAGSASFPAATVQAGSGVVPSALAGSAAFPLPSLGSPKISTLIDSFYTNDLSALWSATYGTVTWSAGRVAIACDTAYDSGLLTAVAYDLTNSAIFAKIGPYVAPSAATSIVLQLSFGNNILFGYAGGNLAVNKNVSGTQTTLFSVTYSAISMSWWRIRESAGTTYFETAPDGATWTTQYSTADTAFGIPLTALAVLLQAGDYGSDAAGTSFIYAVSTNSATALPAVLACPASFPAAAVQGSIVSASPATLHTSVSFPGPTLSGGPPSVRSQYAWPFAWNAHWNIPISTSATYGSPASSYSATLTTYDYSTENYAVENNSCDSLSYPVKTFNDGYLGNKSVYCNPGMSGAGQWNDTTAMLDVNGDTVWQGQTLELSPGGNPSIGGVGNYVVPGLSLTTSDGNPGAHGGSSLSCLGGTITKAELIARVIPHALKMCFNGLMFYSSAGAGYQWPARNADGGYNSSGNVNYYGGSNPIMVEGALLALPPSISIATRYSDPLVQAIATALQNFGAYLCDNTASGYGNATSLIEMNWDAVPYWTGTGTFGSDLLRMENDLMVVTNSTQATPGGGAYGTQRRAAWAPPFSTQPKIGALSDSFLSNDLATTWSGSTGTVVWSSGQVAIKCDTSYDSYLKAAATYDLTGSSFYAKVAPYIAGFAATNIQLQVSTGNNILFGYSGGQLAVYSNINGAQSNLFSTAYSATAHAWWRVRESGGSVFFDTSPDGATWTNQYSAADYVFGFPLTQLNVTFQCGDYGGDPAGTSYVYYVNVTGNVSTTVTPAALAGTVAFAAPSAVVGVSMTASALVVGTVFPARTTRADQILTTAVLAGTVSMPPPVIVALGSITPPVLAKATAFPAVVIRADAIITPPTLPGSVAFPSTAVGGGGPSTFVGTFPGNVGLIGDPAVQTGMIGAALPAGYAGGPSGAAATLAPAVGNGWEVLVRSGADYTTLLAAIPTSMLLSFQFVKQLDDIGSGTVVLSQDDPWWSRVTLPGGLPSATLLNQECLWQFWQDGVVRFEFLGETVTEQLTDPSEQRVATVTGPGTIAALKWAMVAPQGFPDIVQKLDGIQDSFDEVNLAGQGVLDTNIWTTAVPASHIYITPTLGLFNYPGGTGYALSDLYPSGSLTVVASPATTFLGASPYDATDTLIGGQVTPIGVNANAADSLTPAKYGTGLNGSELTQLYIESNLNLNYYAMFGLSASAFYCQFRGPSGTYTKILPAYNATNHAYWMITEQGGTGGGSGTFYFWTSPDGQTWTKQWVIVHNWDARNVSLYFTASYSVDNKVSAQITNLNSNVTTPSYQGSIYLGEPMMGVWLSQFQQAQARGTVRFFTSDITAAGDSFGRAWTDTQNVQATNGTDMYTFLQSACSVVNADYVMEPGFYLRVGQPAAGQVALGVDRSQYLILREGLDCAAKTRTRARNQITTSVGGENADGHEISASSPTFIAQWGQREAWYQTAVQVDPVSMAYATASALAQNETEVLSWTLTLTPNITGKTVFKNFDVGDWLGLEEPNFSAIDDIRVTGIAVAVDSTGNETHELTLVSYIQWLQEQLTYISNRLGGQFVNVIGTSPVAPSKYGTGQVPTYFDPAATLAGLGDVATGTAGSVKSNAPLVYNAATGQYQAAGTTDPVSGETLPVVVSGPGAAQVVTSALGTVVVDAGGSTRVTTGLQPDGTVTVVSTNGPAPGIPDTPAAAGGVQSVIVSWDGLLAGAPPLLDFQYVEVYLGTSAVFAPGPGTLMGTLMAAGQVTIGGLAAGTTYWAKLVAVNDSANSSASSAPASATATGVPGGIITGQIPASLLGNSAGSWALNPNPFFNGASTAGWAAVNATLTTTAGAPSGAPGAPAYVAQLTSTAALGYMGGSPAPFPVTPGQPYSMTCWVYNPSGSPVTVLTGFNWSGGLTSFTCPPGVWSPLTTVATAPPGVTTAFQVVELAASGATVYVSGAVAAGQVSGLLIAADTITANQIAVGIILAGIVNGTIIEGAQFISYGAGGEVLVYSGTPAVGNLVGSWSAIAGNDAAVAGGAGNNYPAGLMIGPPGSSQVTLIPNSSQPFNVTTAIAGTLTAMAQLTTGDTSETFPGIVGALNLGSGNAAKQTLVASSPFASTTGAAMLLESENDGGTDLAIVTFGTISSPDSSTIVFTPLMMLTPYAMVMYSGAGSQVIVTKTGGSGTIPIPAGVTVAKGETWGASGGSGGGGQLGGAGSGGAEYACEPALAVTASGTAGYSVGAGGAAGSSAPGAGGAGGNSTLTGSSVTVSAHGGQGGAANGGAGGAGGTGSANTIAEHGGVGGFSTSNFDGGGGGGGSGGPNGPGFAGGVAGGSGGGAGALAVASGGAGGAGGFGNSVSFGQTGFAGTAPGGGAGGPGGSWPGAGNVVGRAGEPGRVRLTYVTVTPKVGYSVNYGVAFTDQFGNLIPAGMSLGFTGTSILATSGTGMSGRIPLTQLDTSIFTVTQTSFTQLCNAWPIPGGDAQAGTAYRLTVSGAGTQGTTPWVITFRLLAFGTVFATFPVGGSEFPASTPFEFTLTCILACQSATSAKSSITGNLGVSNSVNQLTVGNTVNAAGGFGAWGAATAMTTATAGTMQLQAEWSNSGCSIASGMSLFERLGT
jgi:hypothetical protein